jgi:hypothetical protein
MAMLTYDLDALEKVKGFVGVVSLDEFGTFEPASLATDPTFRIDPLDFGINVLSVAKPIDFGEPLALAKFYAGEVTDMEFFARFQPLCGDLCVKDATQMCRIVLQTGRAQAHGEKGLLGSRPGFNANEYQSNRFYMPGFSRVVWMTWQISRTLSQHEPQRYWNVRTSTFNCHRYAALDLYFVPLISG